MAVVLLAGVTSCVQDTTEDAVGGLKLTQKVTITMSNVASPDVKTALGEKDAEGKYPLYWSNGDQVSINGVASNKLALEENAQSAKALFEVEGVSAPFKVSYPATKNAGEVLFAAKQTHTEGTFSAGAAPMYGESETASIELKHLVGVLKFGFLAPADTEITIDRLLITSEDANLAGTFTAEVVEGEVVLTPTAEVGKSIVYDCNGIALSSEEPTYLYVTVPAGEYDKLRISLFSTDNTIMEFAVRAGDKPIKAGVVREFGAKTFQGNSAMFLVEDSESLMEFAKLCAENRFTYTGVNLTKSFTFDDETYDWTPVSGFEGIFNGNDNTITGLTDALFYTASGYIHNLTLVSTIEKTAFDSDGVGLFANLFKGRIIDCTAKGSLVINGSTGESGYTGYGGVIGEMIGSIEFLNVVNEATITVKDASCTRSGVAGILGGTQGAGEPESGSLSFTNCHNKAALTAETCKASKEYRMGGILGYSCGGHSVTITGCSNSGNITNNAITANIHMGGLMGANINICSISDSYNTGNITCGGEQTATGNNYSLGGIVGYHSSSKGITIANCTNGAYTNKESVLVKQGGNVTIGTAPGGTGIGGIVGTAANIATVTSCSNYGKISQTGVGGASNSSRSRLGGIVGRNNTGAITASSCHNFGDVEYGANKAGSRIDIGGICGYAEINDALFENCTNSGTISHKATEAGTEQTIGGICGNIVSVTIKGCDNLAEGVVSCEATTTSALDIGGIVGGLSGGGCYIYDCENFGTVEQKTGHAARVFIGGIGGYGYSYGTLEECHNYGSVQVIPLAEGNNATDYLYIGGVLGRANGAAGASVTSTIKDCSNEGVISLGGKAGNYAGLGGVIGGATAGTSQFAFENVENNAAVTISGESKIIYAGGVVGNTTVPLTSLTNTATVTFGGTASNTYHAGGVVGNSTASLTSLTNSGKLAYTGSAVTAYYIGGVIGSQSGANVSTLNNSGVITFNGALTTGVSASNNYLATTNPALGGVIGYLGIAGANVFEADNLVNTADIKILPPAGNKVTGFGWAFGGVIGIVNSYKITNAWFKKNDQGVAPKLDFSGTSGIFYKSSNANGLLALAGIVAGVFNGVEIDNCQNDGTIYLNAAQANSRHNNAFGGIAAIAHTDANAVIKNCTNNGAWISGEAHKSSNKSMYYGGILGSGSASISDCTNNGSVLFKTITGYSSGTNYWYTAFMGGIVGNCSAAFPISRCTDNGKYTVEANSLTGTSGGRSTGLGGMSGAGTPKLDNCHGNGTFTVDENCGAFKNGSNFLDESLFVGGLLGRLGGSFATDGKSSSIAKSTAAYIAKDCTVDAKISVPGYKYVGLVCACDYERFGGVSTTPVNDTDFPIMNCKVDGAITKAGAEITDVTSDNFFDYVYGDTPSVASWTAAETLYHGNYGVKAEGGDSGEDL